MIYLIYILLYLQLSPRVRTMRHDASAVTILVGSASSLADIMIVHHNSEHSDHSDHYH